MAIFDFATQYFTNRMNQATQPFTDPMGYLDQRMDKRFGDLYETEEERRRREQQEALARGEVPGPVAPPQAAPIETARPTPVKQTVTFDPVTGEQKMKIEGPASAFSADNPNTPTLTLPGQTSVAGPMAPAGSLGPTPEEILRDQEQRRQYEMMMARPAAPVAPAAEMPGVSPDEMLRDQEQRRQYEMMMARPAAPVAPAAEPVQMAAAPATTMTDVTAPTTGQIAPAAPAAQPNLDQQYAAQDIQEGPVAQQAAATGGAVGMNYANIITAAQRDPAAMERIARDPNTPEAWRRVAASQSQMTLEQKRKMEQAEARAKQIIESGGRSLGRELRRTDEEGSYLKAYLFSRFRMNDLARAEQAKLTTSWQQGRDSENNPVLIQMRGDGRPLQGVDRNGNPLPEDQLLAFAGGIGKTKPDVSLQDVEATIDGKTIKGRVVTTYDQNNRPTTMVESGGRMYAYDNRWKNTSIGVAAEKATAQKQINLAYDPIIKAATTSAEELTKANIKYGTNFAVVGRDNNNQPIIIDQNNNTVVRPDSNGQVTVTSNVGTARGAGVPAGGTQALEISGDIRRTAGQEAVKGVETFSQQSSERAAAASETASVARRIRTTVEQNPDVVGILTKKNNNGSDIITATVAAIDAGLGGSAAIEAAAKQMNFNPAQQAVFEQIRGDLTELALARARENKGQGTFTDFERRLFAETTGDIARNQARAIQYRMEIFEYAADKANRKSEFIEDFRSRNPNATTAQINNAFRKYNKEFDDAFEQRMRDTYINPKQPRVLR